MSDDQIRLAVLIDADNTSPRLTQEMFDELARFGPLTVKRAYGDWTSTRLNGWKDQLLAHAISPMQQFAYTTGKNSTDSALIIDAMDLLYAGNVDGFVIVSSDSDFTRLATRLRESGMTVYGVGQSKTPKPFQDACDQFIFLELLRSEPAAEPSAAAEPVSEAAPVKDTQAALQSMLTKALNKTGGDDGWSRVSAIGSHLTRTSPSFDSRAYDFAKLGDLVQAQPYLETRTTTTPASGDQLWARLKGHRSTQKADQRADQKDPVQKDPVQKDQGQKDPVQKGQGHKDEGQKDQPQEPAEAVDQKPVVKKTTRSRSTAKKSAARAKAAQDSDGGV